MKKPIWTSAVIVLLAVSAACGGGGKRSKGALLPNAPAPSNKPDAPPAGQQAPKVGAPGPQACGEVFQAAWVNTPHTFNEAVQMAPTVVEADVSAVTPGDDFVIPASQEPGGEYRIPTLKVTAKVSKSHKGQAAPGQTLTLFQTGSACRTMHGDPPFQVGERHLLLLQPGPRDMLTTISPDGRFKEAADGTLEPTVDSPATREVKGKKMGDIEGQIRDAAALPPITVPVPTRPR